MHNWGIVAASAAALALLVTLTGCSTVGSTLSADSGRTIGREALGTSTAPEKGDCWTLSYRDFLAEPRVAAGAPVTCSAPHQAYTFEVEQLGAQVKFSDASNVAADECSDAWDSILPRTVGIENRLLLSEALPSSTEWDGGARWARCDLQETKAGSSFYSPELSDLPAEFATIVNTDNTSPQTYALCVDSPGTNIDTGPNLNYASIADCSTSNWHLEPTKDFVQPAGTPYPSDAELDQYMHAQCGALYDTATVRGWVFYPSESDWNEGSRQFECWVGPR